MIRNFYSVMTVIGMRLFILIIEPYFKIFLLVVITCTVVHRPYRLHLKAIGDVNYVALNLANYELDR